MCTLVGEERWRDLTLYKGSRTGKPDNGLACAMCTRQDIANEVVRSLQYTGEKSREQFNSTHQGQCTCKWMTPSLPTLYISNCTKTTGCVEVYSVKLKSSIDTNPNSISLQKEDLKLVNIHTV